MSHIALYRAWRPRTFQEIAGQEHVVKTLKNALREGRFSHAYLFSGPRGTGKTSAAKILAKAVNCERGPAEEPCNECEACRKISDGSVMDVVEIDAASNRGVEEIRDLRENVKYAPSEVRCKVFIIDEVHMLTTEAFNALLKTLEEPPPHVVFILATTEPHRIPATIHSRCQRFDFRRISLEDQLRRLEHVCTQEGIEIDNDALRYIARLSDGGMRDALSLLDQIVAYAGGRITLAQVVDMTGGMASERFKELSQALRNRDGGRVLGWIGEMMREGKSAERCMENLILYFRDLLMILTVPGAENMTDRILDVDAFRKEAEQYDRERLFEIITVLNRYYSEMKFALHPRTLLEVALLKLCYGAGEEADRPSDAASGANADASFVSAARGAPAYAPAPGTAEFMRRVAELEDKIAALERLVLSPKTAGGDAAKSAADHISPPASRHASDRLTSVADAEAEHTDFATGAPAANRTAGTPSGPVMSSTASRFRLLQQAKDDAFFDEVSRRWNEALSLLKERKITVHAWLVNGEPVMAGPEFVLVGFKNTIHRETTEKPANRKLIEQVLYETFGKRLRLETIMLKEWQRLKDKAAAEEASALATDPSAPEQAATVEAPSEALLEAPLEAVEQGAERRGKGEPDHPAPADGKQAQTYDQEWIREAIDLFGEDLVTVKEDKED